MGVMPKHLADLAEYQRFALRDRAAAKQLVAELREMGEPVETWLLAKADELVPK